MERTCRLRIAAATVVVVVVSLGGGCAAPAPPAPPAPRPSASPAQVGGAPGDRHGRHGVDDQGRSGTRGLPTDWPADVPVPPGAVQGSTGAAGRWTVQLLVQGSAAQVHRDAVSFYLGAGFTAESDSVVRRGTRRVTVVVENRDHSATETYLVLGVTPA